MANHKNPSERRVITRKIMRNIIKNQMKKRGIPHVNKNLKSVLKNADKEKIMRS